MNQACPRCGAPLHGPVCGMCGTRVDAAQPPTQPQGYPPPGMHQPGMQQPMYPPQQAYAAPAGPPPSKAMAMTGGIMAIVLSSIYLLIALLGIIGGAASEDDDKTGAMIGLFVFLLFGGGGVVFGVFATKGRWWGAMMGGILQTIFGLFMLLGYIGLSEAEKRAEGFGGVDIDALDTVKTVILVWLLITAVVAIFNYIGISSAKRWEQASSRSHLRAADQF